MFQFLLIVLTSLTCSTLTLPQLFSPGRSCNLVRSDTNSGSDCFSEPECRQECTTLNQQRCANQPSSGCFVQQCRTVTASQQCSQLSQQQCSIVYDLT